MVFESCAFLSSIFSSSCLKNTTDRYVFRASAEVTSPSSQLSQDKAVAEAKRKMLSQIDEYIVDKLSYKTFMRDNKFEERIDSMRNKILENSEISCSHLSQKSANFIYSTTLQINISTVDEIIAQYK